MKRSAWVLLLLLTGYAQQTLAQQPAADLNDKQRLGRQIVAQACGVCHLPPERNAKTYGPALTKAAGGGDEAVMREYILNGTPRMPSFKYFLQPAEIDAIVAYLKTVPVNK
jgi:mono/diheme cytochrome c family protein